MVGKQKIYEGKAKVIFKGPKDGTLVQYFKDDATAFNAKKFDVLDGKGEINNLISEFLMNKIKEKGIPTHFIERLSTREQLILDCNIIPLEVVIRNIAAGSICSRLGVQNGLRFKNPLLEFYYKNDELGDPIVNDAHINLLGWSTPGEIKQVKTFALKVNKILSQFFLSVGITLIDLKLEFGRVKIDNQLVVADEISPDSCRLCDTDNKEKFDKDIFRFDTGDLVSSYRKLAQRLGVIS